MTRDIININEFTILVELADNDTVTIDSCSFEEPLIAVAFYGSGNVELAMNYRDKSVQYDHTKGLALSFYADETVEAVHKIYPDKPLQCLLVATAPRNLDKLPNAEGELFSDLLHQLVNPADNYVEGPRFFMTPEMQSVVDSVFENSYEGKTKMMFFRSQVTVLLCHFFEQLANSKSETIKSAERLKLNQAKEILAENLENPPSLAELSRQIGLNTFNLKKNFKALFGVPVFKYLQNERLTQAHRMIREEEVSVQEAAWNVGYDSLSSFSNAFTKKFGYRPSQVKL